MIFLHFKSYRYPENMRSPRFSFTLILLTCACTLRNQNLMMSEVSAQENDVQRTSDECQVTPVIHVLQYPGCVPKPIPSFACIGRCESYIQVSGSKIWQLERSCMCCQVCQTHGMQDANFTLSYF